MSHVTTFYSFKGGVGRTLLLANVGALLARRGRVLLWDLDLEAPGMHRIPALAPARVGEEGFLEWMGAWQAEGGPLPLPASLRERLLACVCRVPGQPRLSILPAFGEGANFARLHNEVDWLTLLVTEPERGHALFRALVDALSTGLELDHLLVDSRTGVTDLGALLAAVLPDTTVLVGSLAWQNTYGLLEIKKALEPATEGRLLARGDRPPLELLLVASPVPADPVRRDERRRQWDALLKGRAFAEVPFDPRLLFAEDLLALTDAESPVAEAYRVVAERIAQLRRAQVERLEGATDVPAEGAPRERRFEDRVARLLELGGFAVTRGANGEGFDFSAARAGLVAREQLVVSCKDGRAPVGKDRIEGLRGVAAARPGTAGMFVARAFTAAAREASTVSPPVHAVTIGELEQQLFDAGPYLARLRAGFEASGLARTYVAQRVVRDGAEGAADLLERAHAWATGASSPLWIVLGDYGTGKTAFFRRFAYELALRAQDDPTAPVPLAVDLKRFPNAISLEGLLQEHLRAELGWHGNPALILELLSAGRVVLLLDGFDEMGVAAAGRGLDEQLRQLVARAAEPAWEPGGNRVLLTCRTHFFRDQQQVKDVALGATAEVLQARDSALGDVARGYRATIDELALFDSAQVDTFLRHHLGERAAEARALIDTTYDLASLAPRPVLLEMIIQSLPELAARGGAVTVAGLYTTYTDGWLREQSRAVFSTTPEQRAAVLELLAAELWTRPERRIHHRDLLAALRTMPAETFAGLDLDRVDLELRTAAFLTRTADGHYGFSHKSFLEFFLAKRVVRAAAAGADGVTAALGTEALSPEVVRFVLDLGAGGPLRDEVLRLLARPYRARASENALRLAASAAKAGLETMVPRGAELQGANLVGVALGGLDLELANLRGADLARADLTGARLGGARLGGASLREARLDGAAMRAASVAGADLTRATLTAADLRECDFGGIRAPGAVFVRADLRGAKLHGADLRAARFAGARLREVVWGNADLAGATAPGCEGPPPPGIRPVPEAPAWWLESGAAATTTVLDDDRFTVGAADGTVRVFDADAGRLARVYRVSGGAVRWVAWCPGGDRLLVVSERRAVVFGVDPDEPEWQGPSDGAPNAAWFPDGEWFFLGGTVYSVAGEARSLTREATWVDVSPDGARVLVVTDAGIVVFDVADGEKRLVPETAGTGVASFLDGERIVAGTRRGEASVVSLTGEVLAGYRMKNLPVWSRRLTAPTRVDVSSGVDVVTVEGEGLPRAVRRADHRRLFTPAASSGTVFRMGASLTPLHPLAPSVVFGWGARLAVREGRVLYGGARAHAWSPVDGRADVVYTEAFPLDVAWTPADDPVILAPGERAIVVRDGLAHRVEGFEMDRGTLLWNEDGHLLLARPDGNVWIDPITGEERPAPPGDFLASAPDGRTLVEWDGRDHHVRTSAGERVATLGHANGPLTAWFSPSGHLVTFPFHPNLRVHDARTGDLVAEHPLPDAHAVSPDDSRLAAVYGDRLRVTALDGTGRPVEWALGTPARHCAFVDADHLVVQHADGALRLWNVRTGAFVRAHLPTTDGWVTVEADGRHQGEGSGLRALVYHDPDDRSALPTTWLAEDLPALRLPPAP